MNSLLSIVVIHMKYYHVLCHISFQELYEYVFCNSYTSNHGFKIFKVIPREEIPCSETITLQQLNMEESCVVTIQFSDDDILKLLNIEPQQVEYT